MSRRITVIVSFLTVVFLACPGGHEAGAFLLGKETKGVSIGMRDGVDLKIRIRLQPRFDFGDIQTTESGNAFTEETDFYFRRVRLELKGHLTERLGFALDLKADRRAKTGNDGSDTVRVHHVFIDYRFNQMAIVRIGEKKLPYTRVAYTSSSKQLLIDRPEVIESGAKKFFPYEDPMIMLYGRFMDGVVRYNLALSDGWVNGDDTLTSQKVDRSGLLYVARLVLSPPGWVEKKQSDAHLARGRHLAIGLDYAIQDGIEYDGNDYRERRSLWSVDLSAHHEGLSFQAEYASWKGESTDPSVKDTNPMGWYGQAGYFFRGVDVEPAVRYEVYDHDSKESDKKEQVLTLGFNWYPKGHSTKIQINYSHHSYDDGLVSTGGKYPEDSKDLFKVQAQFYF